MSVKVEKVKKSENEEFLSQSNVHQKRIGTVQSPKNIKLSLMTGFIKIQIIFQRNLSSAKDDVKKSTCYKQNFKPFSKNIYIWIKFSK